MAHEYNFYEIWKDFYSQSSNFLDEKVKEEFPSQGLGQILEKNLQFKKMFNETIEQYLEFVNLPTRNDLANIASLIVNIDSKVDDLEELVEESEANQADSTALQHEMGKLKKDMKSLDNKLNQILTLIKYQKDTNKISNK
ncbi:polyhydroxyalkanoic acid synthase subunit PhaR [Neobacillus pocheonensis]|uniref:Polyhydroxyalkanoic acid synthase subunit PhaR n=1 Tax=Neobacillus pocheonensis TaxID=363869 RepID=A0ABT0W7L9_9BACI|nr:polyhydroxyalkanoic acid synthase subunit PhaR [Neobacillus pocheonensis]